MKEEIKKGQLRLVDNNYYIYISKTGEDEIHRYMPVVFDPLGYNDPGNYMNPDGSQIAVWAHNPILQSDCGDVLGEYIPEIQKKINLWMLGLQLVELKLNEEQIFWRGEILKRFSPFQKKVNTFIWKDEE